jgi:hypothetical protein
VPLFARENTDVLVMKNGDRMTCQVKGLDTGVLYVSFDYIDGTTSVQWSKVARLESKQLFIVKTQDGSVCTGRLNTPETPAGQPVKIQVMETPDNEVVINRSQIVKMGETFEKFLATIQRRDKLGDHLFQRQSINPVQLRLPDRIPSRTLERSGQLQFAPFFQ